MSIALPLAIAAYTLDISDRLGWINSNRGPLLLGWGRHNDIFFDKINSRLLIDYKDQFNVLFILEVPYGNIDKMTDTGIEKSTTYTITGDPITMAVQLPTSGHLRVSPPPDSKIGDIFEVLMDFNLVLLPKNSSPEQIRSLSDVERLGGKIIWTSETNVEYTVPKAGG